jgi:type II secretory ATPase GspE/PulE/Tfp pilus assembly ATPase PilB-like protein
MGLEPYLVASSVEAFIAQRLVRVICESCKESYQPSAISHQQLKAEDGKLKAYKGKGCEKCKHTGYKGRTAIYEILMLNEPIRELIMKKASSEEIKKKAVSLGMRTLKDDGLEKIKAGITTVDEVMRVTQISE